MLAADLDIESTLRGLLARPADLGLRDLTVQYRRHPQRDAGCRSSAEVILRAEHTRFDHALVVFDHHGSGDPADARTDIEDAVSARLDANGWAGRAAVVVIEPEIEAWVWSRSPVLAEQLGWAGRLPELRTWLSARGLLARGAEKPADPKTAMREALREAHRTASASIFERLGRSVDVRGCEDPAFRHLLATLRRWFPVAG